MVVLGTAGTRVGSGSDARCVVPIRGPWWRYSGACALIVTLIIPLGTAIIELKAERQVAMPRAARPVLKLKETEHMTRV